MRTDDPDLRFLAAMNENRESPRLIAENKLAARGLVAKLSKTERLVLGRILAGWSALDIAAELEIPKAPFDLLRARLFMKLGASSTAEAVRIAILAGLE